MRSAEPNNGQPSTYNWPCARGPPSIYAARVVKLSLSVVLHAALAAATKLRKPLGRQYLAVAHARPASQRVC